VTVAGTVPKTLPAGQRRYVLVCGSARAAVKRGKGSCMSAGWAQTSAAGVSERLEAAVASRRLSAAKASVYALYAINRDPRLPVELRDAPGGSACVSETFDGINYLPDRQDWDVAFGQRDIYLKVVTDTQTGLALSAEFGETITGHLGTTHHTKASGLLTVSKWEEPSG